MSGWEGSNRRAELPANWGQLRARILERDGHRCRAKDSGTPCGQPATDVDHIDGKHDHRPENLQALCRWHHLRKTSAEGNYSPNRVRVTETRTSEQHPGLL